MNTKIVNLLNSDNPNDRKRAIKLLANEGTEEAVIHLSALYKTEPDADVRTLAVQAGKFIRQRNQKSGKQLTQRPAPTQRPVPTQPPARQQTTSSKPVGQMQRTRANHLIEAAMDRSVADDDVGAKQNLIKAFQTNPDLINDDYAMGIATSVLGVGENEARTIVQYELSSTNMGTKQSPDILLHEDDATWNDAAIDVLIYMLIIGVTAFIANLLTEQRTLQSLGSLGRMIQPSPLASIGSGLISGFGTAIESIISIFIWFGFIHVASKVFLSGNGTFRGLLHNALNIYAIFNVVMIVVGVVFATRSIDASARDVANNAGVLLAIFVIVLVIFLYFFSARISKNYQLTPMSGCVSLIIAAVINIVISVVLVLLFGTILNSIINDILIPTTFNYTLF